MNTNTQNVNLILTGNNISGLLFPAYLDPSVAAQLSNLNTVIAQAKANPNVPVVMVINPNNGPATSANSSYASLVQNAQAAGLPVIGYIHSKNAKTALATMKTTIDTWFSEFPNLDGIFIDEMDTKAANASYYAQLTAYVKTKGTNKLVVGNPGTNPDVSYFSTKTADIIVVEELDKTWPTASEISEGTQAQRATIATSVTFNASSFEVQFNGNRLVWATDQNNQYNNVPSVAFLNSIFAALSAYNGNTASSGTGTTSSNSGTGTTGSTTPARRTKNRRQQTDRRKAILA